jgi:hypothetical protein
MIIIEKITTFTVNQWLLLKQIGEIANARIRIFMSKV